ncbi:hypothetical protein [Fusibacter sp. JL216-2]|uniref:hypothetical protein n=1 Tax=Fusibacter sp. JL216-2 TaxID=3071453 RepID=UPI003D354DC2
MVRKSTEQRAFEKSRKDILKLSDKEVGKEEEQKYAWEIELEEYRNRKRLDRFLILGALCGILSLLISLYVLYGHVYGL